MRLWSDVMVHHDCYLIVLEWDIFFLTVYHELKGKVTDSVISLLVQHKLLSVHAKQLLEKEHSRCHALLRDYKVEDFSRMYRLCSNIPRGLDLVSNIFKQLQLVTAEGGALIKQAENAASNTELEVDSGFAFQVLISELIELLDKHIACVNNYLQNHTLFRKSLKEAFEVIYKTATTMV